MKWKCSSDVKVSGEMRLHRSAVIKNCVINVGEGSCLELGEGARLENVKVYLSQGGSLKLEAYARLIGGSNAVAPRYNIVQGSMIVGHHSVLACCRTKVRFGGKLVIGSYVNVNEGSEFRADDSIVVGDYGMISYFVRIWDTNVHCIYPSEKIVELKMRSYPKRDYEFEKPKTAPVIIGSFAWIGERVMILKGCEVGDNVIVGANTILSNKKIGDNTTVVQHLSVVEFVRNEDR